MIFFSYKHNFYRDAGVLECAKTIVIDELVDILRSNNNNPTSQVRFANLHLPAQIGYEQSPFGKIIATDHRIFGEVMWY